MTHRRLMLAVAAAVSALTLTACGSSSSDEVSTAATGATDAATCPTAQPDDATPPTWTLPGITGSLEVLSATETAGPRVEVSTPFSVEQTTVQPLGEPGAGDVVAPTATVSVCYLGVNGRTGETFDSAFERGAPASFSLSEVIPGFAQGIEGQTVGSSVAVAIAPADGYPSGEPAAGIDAGDTLVFALTILDAQ